MKKILFGILGILCLLSIGTSITYASAQQFRWDWMMCTGLTVYANDDIIGNIGSTTAYVAWIVPGNSYENEFGCNKYLLSDVSVTVIVNHPGAVGVPSSKALDSSNNALWFPLQIQNCNKYGCSKPIPYNLHYGDQIIGSINACYNGLFCHPDNFVLKVTS